MNYMSREIPQECEYADGCDKEPTHAWSIDAPYGMDGVMFYCPGCSQSHAERDSTHTFHGEVNQ